MTTRLVWRPTSFRNMWPSLLNWRQGLREKIFPRTKSDLAAGGLSSCEWAASKTAQTEENTLFFSTQVTLMHLPPLQAMHHPSPWQRLQRNRPLTGCTCVLVITAVMTKTTLLAPEAEHFHSCNSKSSSREGAANCVWTLPICWGSSFLDLCAD